jgi:hypothetical protein
MLDIKNAWSDKERSLGGKTPGTDGEFIHSVKPTLEAHYLPASLSAWRLKSARGIPV